MFSIISHEGNEHEGYQEMEREPHTLIGCPKIKKKIVVIPSLTATKWKALLLFIGSQNGPPLWRIPWQLLKMLNRHLPGSPSILFVGIHCKEM